MKRMFIYFRLRKRAIACKQIIYLIPKRLLPAALPFRVHNIKTESRPFPAEPYPFLQI